LRDPLTRKHFAGTRGPVMDYPRSPEAAPARA
jgi:hypothetical protein